MNVIGYIRVSTLGQVKDGYSLTYQKDEIKSFCEKKGWNLLECFIDAGISGAKIDEEALEVEREGFQDMLTKISTSKVDFVIVLNTNRLWRSDIVKVLVHRELKRYGVDVKSIEQPNYSIYKKDPNDFLVNGLMELLDEYQRMEIAMKLGRGRNMKARQGKYAGGRAAFGYRAKKGQKFLEINHEESLVIKRLFELKGNFPKWSLSELASQLNAEGYHTQQRKKFTKMQVKRILDRREFYEGTYCYGDIKTKGVHEPIL
ncbi:recombinase family protein [Robertmurraya andreesenii]|uniref:DNA invertase Pin-like site-specific DNA recombinase n=1 Tax=Anoxybacillus andreesenii TaxID=1325932 RepID=A0ABT9VAX2_9BACL|nr:recombinase family protein [Robertmurraya andreesenii]MDQ0157950.1 DNA invertase Pin-like site-specific DNA recombinase [Robertmurraya andreesenii]